jgi:hypothetical protein
MRRLQPPQSNAVFRVILPLPLLFVGTGFYPVRLLSFKPPARPGPEFVEGLGDAVSLPLPLIFHFSFLILHSFTPAGFFFTFRPLAV